MNVPAVGGGGRGAGKMDADDLLPHADAHVAAVAGHVEEVEMELFGRHVQQWADSCLSAV